MKSLSLFNSLSSSTNQRAFSTALVVLRVGLGVQFFYAGVTKFGGWSAAGYLSGSTGPLATWFASMAGSPVVDQLNIWGLTLVGIALILGLAVRPAAFFGAIIMALYYLAHFEQNTEHGLIDSHIIYILVFILFLAGGIGHVAGLDGIVHRHLRKRKILASVLFG